jgi:hypothetical protein
MHVKVLQAKKDGVYVPPRVKRITVMFGPKKLLREDFVPEESQELQ